MKKVLYIATITRHIMSFHLPYIKELKEKGYLVDVASNNNEYNYQIPNVNEQIDIPFERSPYSYKNIIAFIKLKKKIELENYDFIHCHTPIASVITRLVLDKKSKTKIIYTAHGYHFYKGAPLVNWLIYYPVEKKLSKRTNTIITINHEDYLISQKFNSDNVHILNGIGVDSTKFFKADVSLEQEIKKKLGIKSEDIILFYAAEFNENKNQKILVSSLKYLIKVNPKIKLVLAGEGEMKNELIKYAQEINVSANILFLGQINNIDDWLKVSKLVLSSSKREGLPVNLIEAMFSGLPAVVSNCRGNKDLIDHGKNGYVFNSKIELIYYILKILNDKKLYSEMSYNSLEKSKIYEVEIIKNNLLNIYNGVINV